MTECEYGCWAGWADAVSAEKANVARVKKAESRTIAANGEWAGTVKLVGGELESELRARTWNPQNGVDDGVQFGLLWCDRDEDGNSELRRRRIASLVVQLDR
jgi:hypothetical protein